MSVAQILDHAAQAQGRLLEQLKNRPVMTSIIAALAAAVQLCEGQLYALYTGRSLFGMTAQGKQLDDIGAVVGIARSGQSDASYYVTIAGQVAANSSQADHATPGGHRADGLSGQQCGGHQRVFAGPQPPAGARRDWCRNW